MGTSRYINAIDLTSVPKITVAGVDVTYSAHVKYLGVWIANNLSWDLQVSHITNKVRSTLHQLKLCRHLIPDTLKIKLVVSLIYPHIDYCCAILTDITAELNLKLYRAMNACMRFIFCIKIDEHISPYYTRLRWLKVDKRREYLVACLLFNILKYQQPDLLYRLFSIKVCSSSRSMRSAEDLLSVPQCRTELYRRSYRLSAIRLWNRLPLNLRNESSSVVFKNGLYAHLLDLNAEV
ncbi:uncharacterized protein LOC115243994 [Formica exsecta]|uniref:uncharacterized protein LOC115243994 n=1 Tax=Formica exsecta TaxID=72781 RepID=UPI00114348FC|nr:uncharacterized protein LOC115243994 [Formica exsecta]